MDAMIRFNERVIGDVLDGSIAGDVARTLVYAMTLQHRLVEGGALEQRVAALELRLSQPQAAAGRSRW